MRRLLSLALILVVAPACGGDGSGADRTVEERGEALEDVPLTPDEAPDGLVEDEEGSGPVAGLREVLPPRRTAPGAPEVPRSLIQDFEAGYRRLFVDEDGGPRSAASSAIRFGSETSAASCLSLLETIHDAASDEPLLGAEALGEGAYGWTRLVPGAETTGFVWRAGDLVLTVTLSGPVGEAGLEQVLPLARRVQQRVP